MKPGTAVQWKQSLPANLPSLVGNDLAVVIGRMKEVCTEDGVVTDYNETNGRINVLFPEYGCEQVGLHVDCFVEVGAIDTSAQDDFLTTTVNAPTPIVETASWWSRIRAFFGGGS